MRRSLLRYRPHGSRTVEHRARRIVESLAVATAGALLARYAEPVVYQAYAATRLAGDWGSLFGTLPTGIDTAAIIEPAIPV